MNKIKLLYTIAAVIFVSSITAFILTGPTSAFAEGEQCFIVSIRGSITSGPAAPASEAGRKLHLDPQYIKVPKGSCVVFMDWVQQGEIRVSFKEGKVCADNTDTPVKIRLLPGTGCYVTDFLMMGETSSLRFINAGEFPFEVFTSNTLEPVASGKITVQ